MNNAPRAEDVARINRVRDYIDAHLGDPLTLTELARVAAFSPFYLHRIFAAIVGETPGQYIRRLRVERAAQQLAANPCKSITTIALDCGFSGSAPFARAFRDAFGMSATEWRRTAVCRPSGGEGMGAPNTSEGAPDEGAGAQHRKDRQALNNLRKAWEVTPVYSDAAQRRYTWRVTMNQEGKLEAQVEVKELPAFTLAYVRHTGPYAGDSELFGRLFTLAGTPATTQLSGTSLVTTAPAATTMLLPMFTPPVMTQLPPIHTSSPTVMGSLIASRSRLPSGSIGWPVVAMSVPGPTMQ